MSRPISRRVMIGMRTACAATAAQRHHHVPQPATFASPEEFVVYELSPGRWRNDASSNGNGGSIHGMLSMPRSALQSERNGTTNGAPVGQGH